MRSVTFNDGNILTVHDEGEAFSDAIVRDGDYYEREILDYLEANHKTHNVILDVGANIGNHTIFFATHLDYKQLWALEPVPDNYELLNENVYSNVSAYNNIRTRRVAVGDGNLDVMMTVNRGNMGACEVNPEGSVAVHQIRVDDLLVQPVTLIKIDVEWYEPFVLLGAKNIIETDRPLILMEDAHEKYSDLLPPYYSLFKEWKEHKTYLYGVYSGT